MQTYMDAGTPPPLPDPGLAAHLIGYLFEAGPCSQGAAGPVPLGWSDLCGWQQATGVELDAWESRTLRLLSAEYLAASIEAESPSCPAPWLPPATDDHRVAVAKHVRTLLRA